MCAHSILAVRDIIGLIPTQGGRCLFVGLLDNLLGVRWLVMVEDKFTPLLIGTLRLIYMVDR